MTTANNEVQEALNSVLNEADTQTANKPNNEARTEDIVKAVTDEALKKTSASNTKATKGADSNEKKDPVPYDRFSEVIADKNKALDQVKSLETKMQSAVEREDKLRSRLGELEQEHTILDAIRNLAKDERYADAVNRIDKALQGIEEEVKDAKEAKDDKAIEKAELKFTKKQEELETLVLNQRTDILWDKAHQYASSLLSALPQEYTDVDKNRLSKMWSPLVNWDAIDEKGAEAIPEYLKSSFVELIKEYGTPQGAVAQRAKDEISKDLPEEVRGTRTPEAVAKSIIDKEWSKTDDKGKPVISDDEFTADMAKLLRTIRSTA
jgi:hypothetical protein